MRHERSFAKDKTYCCEGFLFLYCSIDKEYIFIKKGLYQSLAVAKKKRSIDIVCILTHATLDLGRILS